MRHRRRIPNRPKRRRFSGIRDDTKPTGDVYTTSDGREYIERMNAPKYPRLTTISVSESTRRIYAYLRMFGIYNNYDELLLFMTKVLLQSGKLKAQKRMREKAVGIIERLLVTAEQDCRIRELSRNRAISKRRYWWK